MSQSDNCKPFWPMSIACSGNGICVDTKCVCSDGFLGIGDFAVTDGLDCDIHIATVQVLYAIYLLISIVPLLLIARYFYFRLTISTSHSFFIPINFFPIFLLLAIVTFQVVAVLRIVNPKQNYIGGSYASTFFFGVTVICIWISQFLYLYVFSEMVVKQSKIINDSFHKRSSVRIEYIKKFIYVITVFSLIRGFVPFLLFSRPDLITVVGPFHFIGSAVSMAIGTFIILPNSLVLIRNDISDALADRGVRPISMKKVQDFQSTSSSQQHANDATERSNTTAMQDAERKLTSTINFLWKGTFQEAAIALVFGCWPFFLRKSSYQLPISFSVFIIAFGLEIYSVSNFVSRKKKLQPSALVNRGHLKSDHHLQESASKEKMTTS